MKRFTKIIPVLCLGFLLSNGKSANAQLDSTFKYTGATQTWTVPCGVTSITVQLYGAQGQNSACVGSGGGAGANGGYLTGVLPVSPGDIIYVTVGSDSTGFNGGGLANTGGIGAGCAGGNGGGASDIRHNASDTGSIVMIAGGGGGGGGGDVTYTGGNGGVGGSALGANGAGSSGCGGCNFGGGGSGGSLLTPGAPGCGGCSCSFNGFVGSKFMGGYGCTTDWRTGGGGGGGYYGGGGGGSYCATGGGGGGSSWAAPSVTSVTSTAGVQVGNGMIVISWFPDSITSVTGNAVTNISCNGDNNGSANAVATGGSGSYTYLWAPGGGTNSTETGLTAGTYTITVNDACGSTKTASVNITQPAALMLVKGSKPASIGCNGSAWVTTSGGVPPYTYTWNPGGATSDTIKALCNGSYCCTIKDSNGCTDSVCVNIVLGIPSINDPAFIKVFPDPNNGIFTISGLTKGFTVELYNYMGEKINSNTIENTTAQFNISIEPAGIYLVRIISKDGKLVDERKLIKSN